MRLSITAAQRDALYDQILDRLSGIGDIEIAIEAGRYEDAERIGREYSDELRLLLDDLRIGEGDGQPVALATPLDVLRRALPRLRERAEKHSASLKPEWEEGESVKERNRLISEACEAVLARLDGTTTGSR